MASTVGGGSHLLTRRAGYDNSPRDDSRPAFYVPNFPECARVHSNAWRLSMEPTILNTTVDLEDAHLLDDLDVCDLSKMSHDRYTGEGSEALKVGGCALLATMSKHRSRWTF